MFDLVMLVGVVLNTLGATYVMGMFAGQTPLIRAFAAGGGSLLTEMAMTLFFLGANDWASRSRARLGVPFVSGLAVLANSQLNVAGDMYVIGIAQFLYLLLSNYVPMIGYY